MTTSEFRAAYPEYAHLEGDALWDTMTQMALITQEGDVILMRAKPFWKRYRLRWLFYRKVRGWDMGFGPQYTQSRRCRACKKGVNARIVWSGPAESCPKNTCPRCGEEYFEEPNTGLDHRAWRAWMKACSAFWMLMDRLHIVRSGKEGGRYGMFSDEVRYVKQYTMYSDGRKMKAELRPRKWYEYILIER